MAGLDRFLIIVVQDQFIGLVLWLDLWALVHIVAMIRLIGCGEPGDSPAQVARGSVQSVRPPSPR